MKGIRAILFDLDGTLLDRQATFRHHLERQVARHRSWFSGVDAGRYVSDLLALDGNGTIDRDAFYLAAELHCNLPAGAADALRADFEEHYPESCVAFPGVLDTLGLLRTHGLKLGVITNGRVLIQSRKIDGLRIRPFLDCIVISEAAGVRKPDPRIFARALAQLDVPPSAAVFVGDHPDADVAGAQHSGLYAVWKRDAFWSEPGQADLTIDEIAELPRKLGLLRPQSS
jgi:putative hydrolase of the HAD superfamily